MKNIFVISLLLSACVARTHNADVKQTPAVETQFDRFMAGFLSDIKTDINTRYPKMSPITCMDIVITNVKGNGELKLVAHASASCFIEYSGGKETRVINYRFNSVQKKLIVDGEKIVASIKKKDEDGYERTYDYEEQLIEANRKQTMGGDPTLYFIEDKAVRYQARFADFSRMLKDAKIEPAEFEKIEFSILPGSMSQYCGAGYTCWHVLGKDINGKSINEYLIDGAKQFSKFE